MLKIPDPSEVIAARLAAGLNQREASDIYGFAHQNRWSELEHGQRRANPRIWAYWLHTVGLVRLPFGRVQK